MLIAVLLLTLLVINLPNSHLRGQSLRVLGPVAHATGLDQDWGVFAPDPRRINLDLHALVTYADGSTSKWELPRGDPFVGSYWDYRWRKYMEIVRRDASKFLWPDFAAFVARTESGSRRPVKVELVRRWYEILAPGTGGPLRSRWHQYRFFTLDEAGLRARGIT